MQEKGQKFYYKIRKEKRDFEKFFKLYNVTKDGKIYNNETNTEVKQYVSKSGYCMIDVKHKELENRFRYSVHRLVALKFCLRNDELKNIPFDELSVNHKDGNKLNNCYLNLEWCTVRQNNLHARKNKLNDISLSNSLRWKNNEFSEKTRQRMREIRKENPLIGRKNPNFKYEFKYNNEMYDITELACLFEISTRKIYNAIYGKNSFLEQNNIILIKH